MLLFADGNQGRTRRWLPAGGTLPPAAFEARHRTVVALLWAHVVLLPAFALARGYALTHGLLDVAPILVCAAGASYKALKPRARASIGSLGLVTCSAIFTHLWGGVTEAHFHFFVVVALLSLYEDWIPWLLAIAYVLIHHGVMGALDPSSVYGTHSAAIAHPWRWAGIHAAFIGALAGVNLVSWRSNELARRAAHGARAALAHRATHDHLTGLPNRRAFAEHVEAALTDRRGGAPGHVAVLFVDVDDFKVVNDSLGHRAGDRLLETVADRLTAALRPQDVVARFGGDEFVILVADVVDGADAMAVAERLAATLTPAIVLDGEPRFVTASVGVAVAGDLQLDADQLLQDADVAMYRAKERGKARCEAFDDSLRAVAIRRLALEGGLREALVNDELRLDYQPQVRLPGGAVSGVEALLRWRHPQLGTISPAEFVPMAERLGLVDEIGAWVVREACAEAMRWGRDDVEVAVNVSPRQLVSGSDGAFAEVVRAALADTGLQPHRLCLEITETALLADVAGTRAMLARLRALGVMLAVDDFGVGHASLRHLRQLLPVDIIKIDKSFVDGVVGDAEDTAIISAVVKLADGLGLECVAEGVEDAEQAAVLAALGCGTAQGYHFARPMPPEALRELLRPPVSV